MFSHIMIGSNDVARSKKFYDALFAAMGAQPGVEDARGRVAYSHNGGRFMISKPIDGKPVEIDALLTVTRDLGRMVGVPTPFIDSVLGLARLKATSLGLLDKAA